LKGYTTEARVVAESSVVGKTVTDLANLCEHEAAVIGLIRGAGERIKPLPDVTLLEDDVVVLEGDPHALERAVGRANLELVGDKSAKNGKEPLAEAAGIEAVVAPGSILIGQTAKRIALAERFDIHLLAVSRSGERFTQRLRDITLQASDVLLLKGDLALFPERLKELGILPLAERAIRLGHARARVLPVAILAGAMALTAFGVLPIAIAFFAAAALMVLVKAVTLREAYAAIDWSILVMLGALIPVSEAIRTTGGADLIAGWLSDASHSLPPYGAVALIMAAAMAVTPFLNNAATVLVMAPIAARFAAQLDYDPDAFLMAVAVGAACDFLTPIGHQCNTLVMGPGGYRFGDYWRLGLPLSLIVLALGVPLITYFWPIGLPG
jgi:di/tricarboxylate transporter